MRGCGGKSSCCGWAVALYPPKVVAEAERGGEGAFAEEEMPQIGRVWVGSPFEIFLRAVGLGFEYFALESVTIRIGRFASGSNAVGVG